MVPVNLSFEGRGVSICYLMYNSNYQGLSRRDCEVSANLLSPISDI